jgi:hypothetical protein
VAVGVGRQAPAAAMAEMVQASAAREA